MELTNATVREYLTVSMDEDPVPQYILKLEYTGGLGELIEFAKNTGHPFELVHKPNKLVIERTGSKEYVLNILYEESTRRNL